jgi:cell wall-associated NlpC family hydrolase
MPNLKEILSSWRGVPFKKGQNARSGIDCIHFVDAVYSELLRVPRSSYSGSWGRQAAEIIRKFDLVEAPRDDGALMVFSGTNGPHLGILLSGQTWHASPPEVGCCHPLHLPVLRTLAPRTLCFASAQTYL